jgi:hypothetical protein
MTRLTIFVQGEGKREIRLLELSPNATVEDLVKAALAQGIASPEGGREGGDIAAYAENGDTPLPTTATLEAVGLGNHGSVHLSRCTRVSVTVHYNGHDHTESFGPGVPVHRVKEWAVGSKGFNLDPVDAAEHVLQLVGTADRPDEDVHIGSLVVTAGCKVAFDLVAKVRVEG